MSVLLRAGRPRTWAVSKVHREGARRKFASEEKRQIQMPKGPSVSLSHGKLAKFADGAAVVTVGSTSVLTTAVAPAPSNEHHAPSTPQTMHSFVPLTVDYKQKSAAAGRIPTNFLRKEMGATEKEILTSRVIDRSLRPLFPSGYGQEIQLVCNLLAVDGVNDPDVVAINAASTALATSDIPWGGPVGAVRVGCVGGELIVNPQRKEMAKSDLNLVVTGCSRGRTIMLEAEANNLDKEMFLQGIEMGLEGCAAIANGIKDFAADLGVKKRKVSILESVPTDVLSDMRSVASQPLWALLHDFSHDKVSRGEVMFSIRDSAVDVLKAKYPAYDKTVFQVAFTKLCRELIAKQVLEEKVRVDGRAIDQLRKITSEADMHAPLHGSALFQRGQTQVFCTVALDSLESALKSDPVSVLTGGLREKNFFVHYEFPPYATNEIGRTTHGRRELGHGALAEKALRPVIPKDYPFTIRLTSEVLESNGSSSMATICGGTLALLDAGVPLSHSAAGVAVGLVTDGAGNNQVLLDILGLEDFMGEMDFKLGGTRDGITALQADIKLADGLPFEVVRDATELGQKGINQILDLMATTRTTPRTDKENLPMTEPLLVPAHKRGKFLGQGGINVKRLTLDTGVQFSPKAEGEWTMFAPNKEAMAEVKEKIEELLAEEPCPEFNMGAIYPVKVVELRDRSAMVELHSSMDPVLIPLSQLSATKVVHTSALDLEVGSVLQVKYYGRDPVTGAIRLSRKALDLLNSNAVKTLKKATDRR